MKYLVDVRTVFFCIVWIGNDILGKSSGTGHLENKLLSHLSKSYVELMNCELLCFDSYPPRVKELNLINTNSIT